jgi:NAD(P)-dependent dehydrogenase (short-subunit alcohol dehydrogenase family)
VDLGLSGRACVVTGASRGIGAATARLLAAEGANVLLVARGAQALAGVAAECVAAGAGAQTLAIDVTTQGAGEQIVAACEERLGPLEVLVINAGSNWARPMAELTSEDFERHWRLNVLAPFGLLRAAVPAMARRGWGRVVNVSSIAGKRPSTFNLAYAVTKAGQLALSRGFADTHAGQGVTVNSVLPGPVDTKLWMNLLQETAAARGAAVEDVVAQAQAGVPRGRFGTDDEVASVVLFLCSAQAANVTGAAWTVDGGSVQLLF